MKKALLITLIFAAGMTAAAQSAPKDWAKFYRYEQANDTISLPPRVVFLGDSITDNWARKDGEFFSSNNFAGRGISGQTTSHMLVRFRRDVIDLKPEYVVILAGTNDIALNNGLISLENIMGNIQSMCELAIQNDIKPVLCSVLPADKFPWRKEVKPADDIIKLNEMIRRYANGMKIPYVDYHSILKNENNGLPVEYAKDGVHPNLDCYKIMESIVMDTLTPASHKKKNSRRAR